MSRHLIRTDLLPSLLKKIAPVARKCLKKQIPYEYNEIGKVFKEFEINGITRYIEFTEIELNINPCINGWTAIVQIMRVENGHNLITRCNVPYIKEYDKYINEEIHCEHCKQNRKRKIAYILKNDETNNTMIVGSTCLEEFTGGLDATVTAQCFEALNAVYSTENVGYNYSNIPYENTAYQPLYILSIALAVIKKQGCYVKNNQTNSTTFFVKEFLNGNINVVDGDILDNNETANIYLEWIKSFIESKEELSSYERNLKTVCYSEYICWNEIATLCSIIPVYQRYNKTKDNNNSDNLINEYYGELNQRITINIKNVKSHCFDSVYGSFYIHIFISDEGYTFVWKTNKSLTKHKTVYFKDGSSVDAEYVPNKLKGTISEFNEYQGTKQTILKRCDVCSVVLKNIESHDLIDENDTNIECVV